MAQSQVQSKVQFWYYRLSTVLKSLKTLFTLPQEKIDAFLNSYNIYDHDWADEEQMIRDMGADYYQEVQKKLVDYYSVLNHLCAVGQVEKMYIPPAMDLSVSIMQNQVLFEQMMGKDLGVGKKSKVLDIGCGRGRIANHIAAFTGAHVTGFNLDPDQLACAERFTKAKGAADRCQFKKWDLNHFPYPFADQQFDAVYEVQVIFSLSKDLEQTFREIHRILKPGGTFACLEWVSLDKYDPKDPHHADLMKRIKPLIGAIGTCSVDTPARLLEKVGFEIVKNENASLNGLQAPLIQREDKFFKRLSRTIDFLVRWKMLPKHFKLLFDRLTKDGEAFVEADRLGLVTTSHYMVARKK